MQRSRKTLDERLISLLLSNQQPLFPPAARPCTRADCSGSERRVDHLSSRSESGHTHRSKIGSVAKEGKGTQPNFRPCLGIRAENISCDAPITLPMRVLQTAPLLRHAATNAVSRTSIVTADLVDDLKYQLSNADPDSRLARDLFENPVAAAYLVVLALFGGGLAYLLYLDSQAKAKREAALREQEMVIAQFREQGLEEEAKVMEKDLRRERKANMPAPEKPKGLQAPVFAEDEGGNRFLRRQKPRTEEAREAQREKRKKRKGKRANRPGGR